jgi:hypothetical protein
MHRSPIDYGIDYLLVCLYIQITKQRMHPFEAVALLDTKYHVNYRYQYVIIKYAKIVYIAAF